MKVRKNIVRVKMGRTDKGGKKKWEKETMKGTGHEKITNGRFL